MTRSSGDMLTRYTISHNVGTPIKPNKNLGGSKFKPSRKYKKSVSKSLVYRSLKVDKDGYVGFKVTFSGKGGRANYDRTRVSLILIPEISLVRSYRPIAGAIARATKGEVYTCCYNISGSPNDQLIESIVNRVRYVKSKLRRIDVISQSSEMLHLFRDRLSLFDESTEKVAETLIDTPDGDESNPMAAELLHLPVPSTIRRKRRIFLIRIGGREKRGDCNKSNSISSIFRSVVSKIGSFLFDLSAKKNSDPMPRAQSSPFDFYEKHFFANENLSFENPFHCDIIAKDMLMMPTSNSQK